MSTSDVFRGGLEGAWVPGCSKYLGVVNFGEHFDIIRYLDNLDDKKKLWHTDNLGR